MASATSTPRDPDHGEVVAGDEEAELVEDAVVGQVVLGVAGDDPAPRAGPRRVLRQRLGRGRCRRSPAPGRSVEVADDDRQVAEAVGGEVARRAASERGLGTPRRRTSAGPGPRPGSRSAPSRGRRRGGRRLLGGLRRPAADRRGVAGEVADGGVDLGQGEAQLRHAASVVGGADDARPGTSRATRGAPGAPAARWLTPGARPAASARWCRRHPRGRGSSWRTARCRWTRGGCGRRAGPSRPASAGAGGGRGRR